MQPRILSETPEVILRPTVFTDAAELGPRLRACDLAEIKALVDKEPAAALLDCFAETGDRGFTVTVRGVPTIMAGIAPHPTDPTIGVPWLLASDDMYEIVPLFLKHQHELLDETIAGSGYVSLMNVTANLSPVCLRWLESMGYVLGEILPGLGRNGEDLQVFTREC